MMRVLHVYKDVFPTVAGGIERHIDDLRRGMPDVRSDVLICSRQLRTVRVETSYGLETRVGELGRLLSTPIAPTFPFERAKLAPDIVHLHMPNPTGEISELVTRQRSPVVVTHHADIVRQRLFNPLYVRLARRCLRRASAIVVGARRTAAQSQLLEPYADKLEVIPYAVDAERFDPARVSTERRAELRDRFGSPLIVATGRLVYYKGFHHLIEAARRLGVAVVIVGSGPLEAELRDQARTSSNATLTGAVDDETLIAILAAGDCFALPSTSRAESFGIATLEAQAMGLPAIVSDVGTGTTEAIRPGETGLVVPPGDIAALANSIDTILRDESLRTRMSDAARARVLVDHSLESVARRHRELYAKVLAC